MVSNADFGKFIRELRKEKQMTQMELAKSLNISDKTVSKWEQGKAFPDLALWEPLALELGVGITELFAGQRTAECAEETDEEYVKGEIDRGVKEALKRKRRKTLLLLLLVVLLVFVVRAGAKWLGEKTVVRVMAFEVQVEEGEKLFIYYRQDRRNRTIEERTCLQNVVEVKKEEDV